MDIKFSNKKIKKLCENIKTLTKKFGKANAETIIMRIQQLEAADNLEIFKNNNSKARPHPLRGKRQGEYGIVVDKKLRIVITIDMKRDDYYKNGNINYSKITKIIIKEVKDYHG